MNVYADHNIENVCVCQKRPLRERYRLHVHKSNLETIGMNTFIYSCFPIPDKQSKNFSKMMGWCLHQLHSNKSQLIRCESQNLYYKIPYSAPSWITMGGNFSACLPINIEPALQMNCQMMAQNILRLKCCNFATHDSDDCEIMRLLGIAKPPTPNFSPWLSAILRGRYTKCGIS